MARKVIEPSEHAFILINLPLVVLSFAANIFFAWCLIFPPRDRRCMKQPLKVLLGVLVWWTITYCFSFLIYSLLNERTTHPVNFVAWLLLLYNTQNSMTNYVWLNFYYYSQIVPARRRLFTWVKRNIGSIIYLVLLFNGGVLLLTIIGRTLNTVIFMPAVTGMPVNTTSDEHFIDAQLLLDTFYFFTINVYIFFCLCIMSLSSFSTVHYLYKHMRNMSKSRSPFSSAKLCNQMRVTITGIFQGVFCIAFDAFYLVSSFSYNYSPVVFIGIHTYMTISSLYISGTTINLAIGQTIFRQRALDIWKALKAEWCQMLR